MSVKANFWEDFQNYIGENIPDIIVKILIAAGYGTATSIAEIDEQDIVTIEKFANKNKKNMLMESPIYSKCDTFSFLPGHKKLLIGLGKQAEKYLLSTKKTVTNLDLSYASLIMKELMATLNANANVAPCRRRYSDIIQWFGIYIYIHSGRAAYEILCNNLPLPQVGTILNYISQKKQKIIEGELRCKELAEYLEKLNAPKQIWLCEDGTGIVAKVTYDSTTNQLIGIVLPMCQKTGIPVPFTFTPQSMDDIKKQIEKNPKSTHLYMVLAQPIKDNVPPFILQVFGTDNTFKTSDVLKRWQHTKDQLARYNIQIAGISSDGDARLLASMKQSLNAMFNQPSHDVLLNLNREQITSFVQDNVHTATKLRNRLLKLSILLPMGCKQVSVAHLKILMNTVPKEVHGLVESDICPDDRQNYYSFEKITADRVLNALEKYVLDSEATVKYLKIAKFITQAFINEKLEPLERVYMLWHSLYFLRAWRKNILSGNGVEGSSKYVVDDNFISRNAFICIELNAYGLLHLICKFRNAGQPELFLPGLFSSQPCESTFRQFRSMTTANWTKINFTLHEVLHLIGRIEMQNDIGYFKLADVVSLPRLQKQTAKHKLYELPTNDQIQQVLERAMRSAITDAKEIGMDVNADEISACEIKKGTIQSIKKGTANPSDVELIEQSDDSDVNDTIDCSYFRDYSEQVGEINGNSPYVQVFDKDGSAKLIRKSSVAWIASGSNGKLSNDRLKRVQSPSVSALSRKSKQKMQYNHNQGHNTTNECGHLYVSTEIQIGNWCLFRDQNRNVDEDIDDLNHSKNEIFENIIVGAVLGFKYVNGKTERSKQYGLNCAPVSSSDNSTKRGLGVLATWYKFTECSILEPFSKRNSFFVNIDNYVATVNTPKAIQHPNSNTKSYEIHGNMEDLKKTLSEILC